jgi:excisionase family DNA binding protein
MGKRMKQEYTSWENQMLLKILQVAMELGLAPKTIRKYILAGELRAIRLGRQWRADSDDLALFIEKRRV